MMLRRSPRAYSARDDVTEEASTPLEARLEYRLAFDLAAAIFFGNAESDAQVALLASSPCFVQEWLLRTTGPPTIIADFEAVASVLPAIATARLAAESIADAERFGDEPRTPGQALTGVLWASPQPETWRTLLTALDRVLVAHGSAIILTAGSLNPLLAGVRRGSVPGEPRRPIRGLHREICRHGFSQTGVFTIGGIEALRWSFLGRVASLVGRPDLVDRCETGYRLALAPMPGHRLGLYTVVAMRKERATP
jgi:hypothetical protein